MPYKIRIVTDSTAYLPEEFLDKYPFIDVVPLTVNFEDSNIIDSLENNDEFIEKLEASKKLPATSRPSPEDFSKVFRSAVNEGKEVISLLLSSKLSGTYESALMAAKEVNEDKISVIDTKTTVAGLAYLIEQTAEMIMKGKGREEIVEVIRELAPKIRIFLVPATLEYLKKGGRIGGARAFLGTIMNIKPILHVPDGKVEALDKVRTLKKACARIVEEIPEEARYVVVGHLKNIDAAKKLQDLIAKKAPDAQIKIFELGPVISVHTGPGVIGAILCN